MGWVKGSDRNFEASQTERYRKTKILLGLCEEVGPTEIINLE